ncbi:unnamed protein product [Meganyctiphanes norvegica]|uniref:Exonuclease domain-containing protein n=1 Tax=Meganyctiphanes norvegica TaxID=48144 RepID=A0AAV2QZQ5_MEGNR
MPDDHKMQEQFFDYFLVLDFEATCEENKQMDPQEIIEWSVFKVNAKTYTVDGTFHEFIKPRHNPELTQFCKTLTTITQEMVNAGVSFPTALQNFETWMENDVGLDKRFVIVTCGDWDLKTMLPKQCRNEKMQLPEYCKSWLNIKKAYGEFAGITGFIKENSVMMSGLGLTHEGIEHRATDDCMNISNILRTLAERGYVFAVTGKAK